MNKNKLKTKIHNFLIDSQKRSLRQNPLLTPPYQREIIASQIVNGILPLFNNNIMIAPLLTDLGKKFKIKDNELLLDLVKQIIIEEWNILGEGQYQFGPEGKRIIQNLFINTSSKEKGY